MDRNAGWYDCPRSDKAGRKGRADSDRRSSCEDITSQRQIVLTKTGQTLLLLLAVMMIWSTTAVITDLYDPERLEIQLLVVATMFGSLVVAVALPRAFGARQPSSWPHSLSPTRFRARRHPPERPSPPR